MKAKTKQNIAEQTVVVILAAGKGTRMGAADTPKVCFEISGIPAINRIIGIFKTQEFRRFLVVVGSGAEKVMQTVSSKHDGVQFVFQQPQLGTGHAARVAAKSLRVANHNGLVLVTMGDKFLEPDAIELLVDGFIRKQADVALLIVPKTKRTKSSGGRVLIDSQGRAVRIVEKPDLARQAIVDRIRNVLKSRSYLSSAQLTQVLDRHLPDKKKQQAAVTELVALAKDKKKISKAALKKLLDEAKFRLTLDGRELTADQVEKNNKGLNASLYLCSAEAFYKGVALLDNDNAQREYYLTDIIEGLSQITNRHGDRRYKLVPVAAKNDQVIQGFNSPDELLGIQDYIAKSQRYGEIAPAVAIEPALSVQEYNTVSRWLKKVESNSPAMRRWFNQVYGNHQDLHEKKRKDLIKVLNCFGKRFGYEQKVVIVRAPGRVNLMGRHVDHRGGCNNFLAIHREMMLVAGLRDDNNVKAVNTEPKKFKEQNFNISELIGRFAWEDWTNFVNSDWVRGILRTTCGDWGNYIKAAMLRLQHFYQDFKIGGMDIALLGDIPIAAGLSSSSSIVVATLQAAIALNNLELEAQQFVDLCGEGEWFVGSRGGSGDHAAIYLGQKGKIANVSYFPFTVNGMVDAPTEYQVVIANSHVKATKSSTAKDAFNAKICSYNLGLELLKLRCGEIVDKVEHLRDVTPERLGYSISAVYRFLKQVPQYMTRQDFVRALPNKYEQLMESCFDSHAEPSSYHVRGVLLFGIAESIRSRICVPLLNKWRIDEFGRLMNISHNGDRVSALSPSGEYRPLSDYYDDLYLDRLIAGLASEDPQEVLDAQLYMQPGSYGCSTTDIDKMVDIACGVEGVAGAQIAGAGLGGCIMVLVKKVSLEKLNKALIKNYYRPKRLKPDIITCMTVEGSGLARF